MNNKTVTQKALPMSLKSNDEFISHSTDPIGTMV